MKIELKRNRVLYITGSQGCGKTSVARMIASMHGSYVETSAQQLEAPGELGTLLASQTDVVIVDGVLSNEREQSRLEGIVSVGTAVLIEKNKLSREVKVPLFIFCSNALDQFLVPDSDSRHMLFGWARRAWQRLTQCALAR